MRKFPQFKKNLLKAMNFTKEKRGFQYKMWFERTLENALEKIMPKGMSDRKRELWKTQAKRVFRGGF